MGIEPDGIDGPKTQAAIALHTGIPAGTVTLTQRFVEDKFGILVDVHGDPAWSRMWSIGGFDDVHAPIQGVSGGFTPQGVMIHHTAGPAGRYRIPRERMADGRLGLRGPLVQVGVNRDGSALWVTNGRAHHAGAGDAQVLRAITSDNISVPRPRLDSTYGNTYFLGIEMDHSGDPSERWPVKQVDRAATIAWGWCKAFGWGPERILGHKEWTKRKVDPAYDMDAFRERVESQANGVTEWGSPSVPVASPPKKKRVQKTRFELQQKVGRLEERLNALEEWAHDQGYGHDG
jgi:hypothetical protein